MGHKLVVIWLCNKHPHISVAQHSETLFLIYLTSNVKVSGWEALMDRAPWGNAGIQAPSNVWLYCLLGPWRPPLDCLRPVAQNTKEKCGGLRRHFRSQTQHLCPSLCHPHPLQMQGGSVVQPSAQEKGVGLTATDLMAMLQDSKSPRNIQFRHLLGNAQWMDCENSRQIGCSESLANTLSRLSGHFSCGYSFQTRPNIHNSRIAY